MKATQTSAQSGQSIWLEQHYPRLLDTGTLEALYR